MLRHFFDMPGDQFASSSKDKNKKKDKAKKPSLHTGLESLEERKLLSATLDWANDITSDDTSAFNGAYATFVNADGDVLVGGSFGGTVDFDPSAETDELDAVGSNDGYVATYSSTGELDNVIQLSSTGEGSVSIRGVVQDADGNTYVAGSFSDGLELTDLGNDDLEGSSSFLMKLDTNGDIEWVHELDVNINKLTISTSEGDPVIHLLGTFEESINFDTDETGDRILTSADGIGAFYATFNADGEDTYALGMNGDGNQSFNAVAIGTDAIYIVGSAGDFNEGGSDVTLATADGTTVDETITFEGEGNVNGFVIKLDSDGEFVDSVQIASTDYAILNDITLDSTGNLYIAGQYGGTVDLDPSEEDELSENPSEFTNGMYVSLDSDLTYRFGATVDGTEGETNSVKIVEVDEVETVIFGGYYAGQVDFDPTEAEVERTAVEGGDGYLFKLLTDGTFVDVFTFGASGFQNAADLAVNTDGSKLIVVGHLGSSNTDLDPGSEIFNADNATAGTSFVAQLPSDYVSVHSDFSVTMPLVTLPTAIVTGTQTRGSVRVAITNDTNESPAASDRADIFVYARPVGAADNSDDVLVGSRLNQTLNIGLEKSRTYVVNVTLSDELETDEYELVAIVMTPGEEPEFVGQVSSDDAITIAEPFVNLSLTLTESRIPEELISGNGDRILLPVSVLNSGNVALERGETVNIKFYARPADAEDDSDDVEIGVLENQNVSALRAGTARTFNAQLYLPAGLESDDYNIVAIVDYDEAIEESDETDNEVVTEAAIAVTIGEVNLTATIDDSRLQEELISGNGDRIILPITITNDGNISLDRTQKIDVTIVARPADAVDDSDDVEVAVLTEQNVGNLGAGLSRRINATVTLPAGLESDDYILVAIVDSGDDVEESDETDNEAVGEAEVEVTIGEYNLTATLDETRVPAAAIAGQGTRVILPVTITNDGNIALERTQKIDVTIVARPADAVDDSDDIELAVLAEQNVGNLGAGQSRRVNAIVTLPEDLDADDYVLVAIVDSGDDVEESDETDNEAVGETEIAVADPFVNLSATIDDSRLQEELISGNGDRIVLPITITNDGNVSLDRTQKIDITIVARPADAVDDSDDVEVAVLSEQNVGNLGAGLSRRINATVNLPAGLESDDYILVAIVDSGDDVEESDETDNEAVGEAEVEVTEGVVNLTATIDDSRLQEELISGNGDRIILPITITNEGNISLDRTQTIDVTIVARPADAVDDSDDVEVAVLADQNVGNLGAGLSRRINATVTLPVGLEADDYVLVAIVDSGDDVEESDETDNEAVGEAEVEVTEGVVNLTATIDDSRLQEELISGNGDRIILPITITNDGNIALDRTQTIDVTIVARPADAVDDSDDVEVAVLADQNVGNLGAGLSRRINATVELPAGLESDDYILVAIVDSGDDVDESDETDNEAVGEAEVAVTIGEVNLTATIDETRVPVSVVAGEGARVILPVTITNDGNIALDRTQKIDVTIVARPADAVDDSDDVELAVLAEQNVGNLGAGQSRRVNAIVTLPEDLDADDYVLVAIVDSGDDVEESDETDNEAVGETEIAVADPFVNLSATIDDSRLQEELISGNGDRIILPITITNDGNISLDRTQTIDVTIVARPADAVDDSDDVEVAVLADQNVGNLGAGLSRRINAAVTLPAGLESDDYVLVAIVDSGDDVEESDETDNEAVGEAEVEVTEGVVNLTAEIDDSRLQEELISGNGDRIILPITITNDGNIALERGQTIDITIVARPADAVDDSDDVEVAELTGQNLSSLAAGQSRRINAAVSLPVGLEADDYVLVAIVDSGDDVEESDETDNEAVGEAEVEVTEGVVNLTAEIDDSRLQEELTSGNGDRIVLPITITNEGNISLDRTQKIDITIVARPADAVDDSDDVEVAVLADQNVGNLGAGLSRRINAAVSLPVGLEADDYVLVAIVDSGDDVEESDETDNEAVGEAEVEVTEGVVNLTATIDDSRLQEELISGNGDRIILPITITNEGNISLDRTQTIDVTIVARPADAVDDSDDVEVAVLADQNVGNLGAGLSRRINATVTLPVGLEADDYVLVAIVDSGDDVEESDETDNEAVGEAEVEVTEGVVNLTAEIDDSRLQEELISGNGDRIILPITITNDGNISLDRTQTIDVTIVARPADAVDDSDDVEVAVLADQNVGNLGAGLSRRINAAVTLPAGLESDDYVLVAIVDSGDAVEESDETDNEAVGEAEVAVTIGEVNLTATLNETRIPETAISGDGSRFLVPVTVTNEGNIAIARGQTISISLHANDTEDTIDLIDLGILENANISGLAAGASRTFNIYASLPEGVESSDYEIVAIIDSEDAVEESDEDDNEVTSDAVVEVTEGVRDLSLELDESRLPEAAVTGSNTRFILPVTITNDGNLAMAAGQRVQITVVANRAIEIGEVGADVPDPGVTVLTYDNASVSNLRPGQSRLVNLSFTLPLDDGFEDGEDYFFTVSIDSEDAVDESDEDNNEADTEATVTITRGGPNLTAEIDETNLPTEAISGDGTTIAVPVTVTNDGETRMAKNQTVDIDIYIVEGEDEPVLLTTLEDQNISLLQTGASKTFLASVTLPGTLEDGEYSLVAVVDPENTIVEVDEDDNDTTTVGTIDVTQGSQDLSVEITEEEFADFLFESDGTASLTVTLTNEGNVSTAVDATTQLAVIARPVDAEDDSQDVLVEGIDAADISALAPDESVEIEIADIDLSELEIGEYNLVVFVNDAGLLNPDSDNSEIVSDESFEVTENSNDLSVTQDSVVTADVVEGSDSVENTLHVSITNNGETALPDDADVDVSFYARPVGGGDDVLLETFTDVDIASLAVDGSVQIEPDSLDISGLEPGEYALVAVIDDSEFDLASDDNNEVVADETFTVAALDNDIAANKQAETTDDFETGEAGDANTITVRLTNNGNAAIADETTITMNIYAYHTTDSEIQILVQEDREIDISELAEDDFFDEVVDDLDLSALEAGTYYLVAIIDDSSLAQGDAGNNAAVAASGFTVSDPE